MQVNIPAPCGSLPNVGRIAVGGVLLPEDSTVQVPGVPSWREGDEGGSRGASPSAHPSCPGKGRWGESVRPDLELTQVPLGEKPKAGRRKSTRGNWANWPLTLGTRGASRASGWSQC